MEKKFRTGLWFYLILILVGFGLYFYLSGRDVPVNTSYTNQNLQQELAEKNADSSSAISAVTIRQNAEVPTGTVQVTYEDGSTLRYYTADVKETQHILDTASHKVPYSLEDVKRPSFWERAIPYIFSAILFLILAGLLAGRITVMSGGGQNQELMNFGKSRAEKNRHTGITFADVAGLEEEKEELAEVVDFLKDPAKYTKMGARIPKGVILVGPPGTGKTLLAKAVSGEADVPFFSISGSDFVEMFVGVGASRVRDLFKEAKKNAPCIVFIDEIDAVARRRGSGLGGGHDEREQTLNQLLVEMDGFSVNQGIIVMAATNRVDILDPAILRPGRFDRRVSVGRPDVKGREEILKIHTWKKPLGDDVNLKEIARTTSGFSGADLENLMNESAILAARSGRQFITKADVDASFIKVGIGTEKKSRVVSEEERKITAYHESGHAILFHELEKMDPVYTISIIPTGTGAAGYTMPIPQSDREFMTRDKMLQEIEVSLGGRIAEELMFEDVTTGASQDIRQASRYARDMIMKYGFSSRLGLVNYEPSDEDEVFIGREIGHTRTYSEKVAAEIDEEVKEIVDSCYQKAKKVITDHMDVLHKSAALLLEKEKITGKEFDALFSDSPVETSGTAQENLDN